MPIAKTRGLIGIYSDYYDWLKPLSARVEIWQTTYVHPLPGVGAVTAQKILAWRTQHGRFTSVIQLQQVSGIGPAKYAALAGRVKV